LPPRLRRRPLLPSAQRPPADDRPAGLSQGNRDRAGSSLSVRRLRVVDRGPALRGLGQRRFLSAEALDRDRVQRDLVDARIETLGALAPPPLRVLRHERVEEALPRRQLLDDPDAPEGAHARVGYARVAFEA